MKKILRIIFMIGVIYMSSFYGCSGVFKYEKYSSKDPEIAIAMDYVSGWLYSESRGSGGSYAQVIFYEPVRKDKNLKAGMIVNVQQSSKANAVGVESFADTLLSKRQKLNSMKLLSRSSDKLFGLYAVIIELSYKTLDKLNAADAKLIPVKEKIIILERNNRFYTFTYINTEAEYAKFLDAFGHGLKTLKFKDSK